MNFGTPFWLVVMLIALPLLGWFLRSRDRNRNEILKSFAASHLLESLTANISRRRRQIKRWLLLLGIAFCFCALARLQIGYQWEEVKRKGIDILFAVDTSRSMLAEDVNPNRLARAKMAVLDFVDKLGGDRVGLIAFAGTSFLQCPLTLDYDAFRQSLDTLDTNIIPYGGTNLASAVQEAEKAFSFGGQGHKILVLITDGEDLEANGIAAAKKAAEQGMKIFTIGVGTSSGELIPITTESGGKDFLKDEKGQAVKSRLDENTLKQIAESSGGFYEPLGHRGEGLAAVYEQGLASLPKQELNSRQSQIPLERFQWPLSFAILLLSVELILSDRRKKSLLPLSGKAGVLIALFAFPLLTAHASPQSAERAYQKGNYSEAASQYKKAAEKNPKPELQFNHGTAAYKSGLMEEAQESFQKALKTDQPSLQQQTYYNLGNVQYRIGQRTEKEEPKKTIQVWEQALQNYQNAMKLDPKDEDAKYNYEFVKKKLEELKQQQPKENPEDKKQDQQKEKDKKDQQQQDQEKQSPKEDKKDSKDSQKDQQKQEKPGDSSSPENKNEEKKEDKSQASKSGDPKKEEPQEAQRIPGQMSKEEAKALLDSLKSDEKKMPAQLENFDQKKMQENPPKRDW